jgi:hypothetical protein
MLPGDDSGRNHQVGITLPSVMPLPEVVHHGRTGGIKHHDVEGSVANFGF